MVSSVSGFKLQSQSHSPQFGINPRSAAQVASSGLVVSGGILSSYGGGSNSHTMFDLAQKVSPLSGSKLKGLADFIYSQPKNVQDQTISEFTGIDFAANSSTKSFISSTVGAVAGFLGALGQCAIMLADAVGKKKAKKTVQAASEQLQAASDPI